MRMKVMYYGNSAWGLTLSVILWWEVPGRLPPTLLSMLIHCPIERDMWALAHHCLARCSEPPQQICPGSS